MTMIDDISPHHRTLYIVLDEELKHAPVCRRSISKGGLYDHIAYSCTSCNQRRDKYILSLLLDWDIAIASTYNTPVRSFQSILEDLKAGWDAEIQKIIEGSGALK